MNPPNNLTTPEAAPTFRLLNDEQLLEALWPDPAVRPTQRWFRSVRKAGGVPIVRIQGRVYYDPAAVHAALLAKYQSISTSEK